MVAGIRNLTSVFHLLEENFSVSIIDHNGILSYVNQKFCEISKYNAEELIGNSYGMLNPDYSESTSLQKLKDDIAENKVSQNVINSIAKDGTPYWVQATIIPVPDEEGQIIQFISFDIDATNKFLTEEKYKKAIDELHNIQHALNQSSVVAITDQKGIITYVNEKFCKLSKYGPEELLGQTHGIINSGHHPGSFFEDMWRTIGLGSIWRGEVKNRAKDGSYYWVNTTIIPILGKNGKPLQYISIRTDITAKKEAEHSLEIALKNDFRQTVKHLQNAIFKYTYNDNGKITFTLIEGQLVEKLGITLGVITSNQLEHSFSKDEIFQFEFDLKDALNGNAVQFELSFYEYTFLVYLSPIFEHKKVIEVVGTAMDISERREAEKLVEHMAYYDYLTKLPNRRFFQEKIKHEIIKSKNEDLSFAIMFIDLDRFKNVNDSMGHSIGDKLLIAVGERLKEWVRKGDIVARHGGDEYVILLPSACSKDAEVVAARVISGLAQPFIFNNIDVFVSSSIGISVFPEHGSDYDTLTGNADSAMYLAKENGKNNFQFFNESLHRDIIEKTRLEIELRKALAKKQFVLHYQPQIDLKTGILIGLEALIRWDHPTKGMISPLQFIPIAEETGLIVPIGRWVLETACEQVKIWQDANLHPIQISVNVSIHQFKQASFVDQVKTTLKRTGLQPEYLNLEITESMTSDVESCQITLHELRSAGINVSIDDFGTGYSSLSYLSKFPITHLKIDQAFVQELSTSNKAIVKTIITLAKSLNLTVVAEGVETAEQAHFLEGLDCDEVQGYFYSKPLPTELIAPFLTGTKF